MNASTGAAPKSTNLQKTKTLLAEEFEENGLWKESLKLWRKLHKRYVGVKEEMLLSEQTESTKKDTQIHF